MKWLCAKDHWAWDTCSPPEKKTLDSFRAWLWCQVFHLPHEWKGWLYKTGFIDGTSGGEGYIFDAYWRWDFWNASTRAECQALERREWERKRDDVRRRWGADAG